MTEQVILFCQFWELEAMTILHNASCCPHRGENRSCRGCSWGNRNQQSYEMNSRVIPKVIKFPAICLEQSVRTHEDRNKDSSWILPFFFSFFFLNHQAVTHSSGCQGFPWFSWLYWVFKRHRVSLWECCCCYCWVEGLAIVPPWEYYQNNGGWGCAESGGRCTWAFNQLTWWDYNAYFRGSPSRIM